MIEVDTDGEAVDAFRQGLRVDRWKRIEAKNKKEARKAFRNGDGQEMSTAQGEVQAVALRGPEPADQPTG